MKKPAIPAVMPGNANAYNVLVSLRENVEQITGQRGGVVEPLPATATLPDVVAKVNEIIDRLMSR